MQLNYATARRVGWIALLIAVIAYYPRFAHDMASGDRLGGLPLLRHGAECLLANRDLQLCEDSFTYPPIFAFVMIPFFWLEQSAAVVAWYAVAVAAMVACYQLCETLARSLFPGAWSDHELTWLRVLSLLLSVKFILAVLENQAFDELVLLFILIGLWGLAGRRELLSGASLAFAAAIKGSPLIFLPYLLFTRRISAATVFVGVYLALSFLPDVFFTPAGAAHGYYETWFRRVAMGPLYDDMTLSKYIFWSGPNSNNHSLRGLAYRIFPLGLRDPVFRPVLAAMYVPVVLGLGLILWRSVKKGGLIAVDGAAVIIAMLALSPMTSRSHFVALMLAYVVCCAAAIRIPETRRTGIVVLIISFILASATGNDLVGGAFTDWAYGWGSITFGSLVLLVYLAVIANRAPSERHV